MFKDQTESAIRERMLEKINLDLYKGEGSDLYQLVTPLAMELASFYSWLDYFKEVIFGKKLDDNFVARAEAFGVFRKMGEKSRGELTLVVDGPVTIPKGTRLVSTTDLFFETQSDAVFDAEGSKTIPVAAESVGVQYNISANDLRFVTEVPKVTSTSHPIFTNGIDVETLEQLQQRFLEKLRNPSSSGNVADYKRWAKSIDGVVYAEVYSMPDGPGTVRLVASGEKGSQLSGTIMNELKSTINELAPIGAKVDVRTTTVLKINIEVAGLIYESGYDQEKVRESIKKALSDYLELIPPNTTIVIKKLLGVIMNVDGVSDVTRITVNQGNVNIELNNDQKGVLKEVTYV